MIIKNNKVTLEVGDHLLEMPERSFDLARLEIDRVTFRHAYAGDKKFHRKLPIQPSGNAYAERIDKESTCSYKAMMQ